MKRSRIFLIVLFVLQVNLVQAQKPRGGGITPPDDPPGLPCEFDIPNFEVNRDGDTIFYEIITMDQCRLTIEQPNVNWVTVTVEYELVEYDPRTRITTNLNKVAIICTPNKTASTRSISILYGEGPISHLPSFIITQAGCYLPVPPDPTIDQQCGYTSLTRPTNMPEGIIYYWQTKSGGTADSKTHSNHIYTVDEGEEGYYYLRTYSTFCKLWGPEIEFYVPVKYTPQDPPLQPGINEYYCGYTVVKNRYSEQDEYFWQTSPYPPFNDDNSSSTINVTTPKTVYLATRSKNGGCWSTTASSLEVDVKTNPTQIPEPFTIKSETCDEVVLVHSNSVNYLDYYWQSELSNDESNSDSIYTIYTTRPVFLRSKRTDVVDDCWGGAYSATPNVTKTPEITFTDINPVEPGKPVVLEANGASISEWEVVPGISSIDGNKATIETYEDFTVVVRGRNSGNGFECIGDFFEYHVDVVLNPLSAGISISSNQLTANGTGGAQPYTYIWSTGETTQTISTDGTGSYSVRIIDYYQAEQNATYQFDYTPPNKSDFNFIRKQSILEEGATTFAAVELLTEYEKNEVISYIDGLGRPVQEIIVKGSPAKNDIVQIHEYDPNTGKQVKKYLPYTISSGNGAFRELANLEMESFNLSNFSGDDWNYSFAVTDYDDSPLNRIIEQGAPGSSWQLGGHSVKNTYNANTENDAVKKWIINSSGDCELSSENAGIYPANTLYKFESIDEHGHSAFEFKDSKGNVIYQYTVNTTKNTEGAQIEQKIETYYVYDLLYRLRYVIPPKAVSRIGSALTIDLTIQDELLYSYKYDNKNSLIEKKLPGIDLVKYIYDKRNRLVMSQDGNKAVNSEWSFVKYDILNRQIMSGIVVLPGENAVTIQNYFNNETYNYHEDIDLAANFGYTLTNSFPPGIKNTITEDDLQTITYYDNYSFLDGFGYAFDLPTDFENIAYKNKPTGAVTGTFTRVLDNPDWLLTVNYYDEKGRLIQSINENHANGLDVITNEYDFTGKISQTKKEHDVNVLTLESLDLWEFYTYDHAGRLKKQYHQVGSNSSDKVLLTEFDYNELGQVWRKKLHSEDDGVNFLQTVDFNYNIHGWLTQINNSDLSDPDDLFGMNLYYNNNPINGNNTQFNGNIAYLNWKDKLGIKSGYEFDYDDANRLLNAEFNENEIVNGKYALDAVYDNNGNILKAARTGQNSEAIDDLTYAYHNNGNVLKAVGDEATDVNGRGDFIEASEGLDNVEYTYDRNGNMLTDANKNITFQYNRLNRTSRVQQSGVWLDFEYDALGNKLSTYSDFYNLKRTTIYVGGIIYSHNITYPGIPQGQISESFDLDYILTSEGRILRDGNGDYHYEYFLRDHLGNVRVSFADYDDNGEAEIVQKDSYYPFGLRMGGLSALYGTAKNNYLYNSKELYENMGLDWYDYGSRFYDPQLGRWHVFDPQAEKYKILSPYNYVGNNPIIFIDPNGENMEWIADVACVFGDATGQFIRNMTQLDMNVIDAFRNIEWKFRTTTDHFTETMRLDEPDYSYMWEYDPSMFEFYTLYETVGTVGIGGSFEIGYPDWVIGDLTDYNGIALDVGVLLDQHGLGFYGTFKTTKESAYVISLSPEIWIAKNRYYSRDLVIDRNYVNGKGYETSFSPIILLDGACGTNKAADYGLIPDFHIITASFSLYGGQVGFVNWETNTRVTGSE